MKSKRFKFLLITTLAIFWLHLLAIQVFALEGEPLRWKTRKTKHFLIHYYQGEELLSQKIAQIAERIHVNLSTYFNWSPRNRTDLILSDQYDDANGFASSFPRNKIFLRMSPPDDISGTEDYLDRLTSLLTHEYTHILHIDKIGDRAKIKRDIFGRFLLSFPATFQPGWGIEGLASYMETDSRSGVGRGQSSYYRMLMRMEVLSGIKPFSQVNQPIETWPGGITPYLYGVYFYNFLNETYGEKGIKNWIANYNNTLIPFQINGVAKDVFGKSLDELWREFALYLNRKFSAELDRVQKKGLKAGHPLTSFGAKTTSPRLSGKGDLYFIKNDLIGGPYLMKSTGDSIETLLNVRGQRIDFHPNSGFLIVQSTPFGKTSQFDDIYKISGEDHKITRLTTGGRYTFASWHPKGKKIIAVQNKLGRSSLHLLDERGKLLQILWEGKESVVISNPDWSPSGEEIVAAVKRPTGTWNLEIFSLQKSKWTKITNNKFIEGQPYFSKSGNKIYYSAEYDGIYNIYSFDLKDKKISKISNVLGGAFYPQVSDDGKKLVYKGANKNGFDIYQMEIIEEDFPTPSNETTPGLNEENNLSAAAESLESSEYSPMFDLFPTWWFPYLSLTNSQKIAGLMTSSSDPLLHHQMGLLLAYESQNKLPLWGFSYSYDALRPTLQITSRRQYSILYDSSGIMSSVRSETESSLFSVLNFPGLYSSWSFTGGVTQIDERDYQRLLAGENFAKKDNMLGVSISLNSLYGNSRAINYTEGFYGTLAYVDSDILKGDYQGKTLSIEQGAYTHLGGNHILSEHFAVGFGGKTGRPFVLNSGISLFSRDFHKQTLNRSLLLNNGPFSRRKYSLQGYEENSSELTGQRFLYSNLAWHFPVWLVERGLTAPPIGIHKFHGTLFFSFGDAWQSDREDFNLHRSVGIELTAETFLGYQLPFKIRAGIVRGLDEGGGLSWFLTFDNLI